MKAHKIAATLSVVLGIGIAGYALVQQVCKKKDNFSRNLESLTKAPEQSGGNRIKCYTSFVYESGASVVDCTTCEVRENQTDKWSNLHDYCYK